MRTLRALVVGSGLLLVLACGSNGPEPVEPLADEPDASSASDASAGKGGSSQEGGAGGQAVAGAGGQAVAGSAGQAVAGSGGQAVAGSAGQAAAGAGGQGAAGGGGQGAAGAAPVCGDGEVNSAAEQCDGQDFNGATCASSVGVPGAIGLLGCQSDCTLVTTGCTWCGDGKVNGTEACDGYDFGGKSCASVLGVSSASGSLSCSASCAVSTVNCHYCGDGKKNGYEQCDGADLGGSTCATINSSYTGTLKCSSCTFDVSGCTVACTPSCSGKQCGTNGCGGVCGTCTGNNTCQGGVCTLCTSSCPTLLAPSLPPSLQCTPTANDCSGCGSPSCGSTSFAVTCSGTPVGTEYPKPDIPGCKWKYTNNFCCPAGCTRYNAVDSSCVSKGLPPIGRACTLGSPLAGGCVQLPGVGVGSFVPVCCPQ